MAGGLEIFRPAARDLIRVLAALPFVELWRRRHSLHRAVAQARRGGMTTFARSAAGRARLRRIIGIVDRLLPGGANCVRRALLEVVLDGEAARERMFAGLQTGGGPKSGHAWLESEPPAEHYDAVIAI
jgi:hypothetical protein